MISAAWDVTQGANPVISNGGLTTGKSALGTVRAIKHTDHSSPKLYLACASGDHFRDAVVTWRRPVSGTQKTYLVFKLTDVMIVRVAFAQNAMPVATAEISISYAKIEWTYTRFNSDGTSAGNSAAGWNVATNSAA